MCRTVVSSSVKPEGELATKTKKQLAKQSLCKTYVLSPIVIGQGTFSVVYQGVHRESFKQVAIKIITKSKLKEADLLSTRKELSILKFIQEHPHENVINLLDAYEDTTHIIMVFELYPTDLYEFLKTHCFSEEEAKYLLSQLLEAVNHLHHLNIVHCDLKPENILFDPTSKKIILTDFGFADFCTANNSLTRYHGSFGYVSPEVIQHVPYDKRVDIWSFGIVSYVLFTRRLPFFNPRNEKEELRLILRGRYSFQRKDKVSSRTKSFINSLLQVNPNLRPTAQHLVQDSILFN